VATTDFKIRNAQSCALPIHTQSCGLRIWFAYVVRVTVFRFEYEQEGFGAVCEMCGRKPHTRSKPQLLFSGMLRNNI